MRRQDVRATYFWTGHAAENNPETVANVCAAGHETGLPSTVAATVLGACIVERHITLDRAMWGSDHAASLEPSGLSRLMRDIRLVEKSMGEPVKRILESEEPIIKRLRNV